MMKWFGKWIEIVDRKSEIPKHPMWVTDGKRIEIWLNSGSPPFSATIVTHYIPFETEVPDLPDGTKLKL